MTIDTNAVVSPQIISISKFYAPKYHLTLVVVDIFRPMLPNAPGMSSKVIWQAIMVPEPHRCPPWWSWKKNNPRKSSLGGNPPALPPCLVAMGLVMECFYSVLLLVWPKLKLIMSLALMLRLKPPSSAPQAPQSKQKQQQKKQHHNHHHSQSRLPRSLGSNPPGAKGACCGCCCWSCCWSYCWTHWAPPSLRGQAGAAGGCNGEWSKAVYLGFHC